MKFEPGGFARGAGSTRSLPDASTYIRNPTEISTLRPGTYPKRQIRRGGILRNHRNSRSVVSVIRRM